MNKLRHSTYTHTPSGTKSKDVALLLLSLSILHYFSSALKNRDLKPKRAKGVRKSCLWQFFQAFALKSGTEAKNCLGRRNRKIAKQDSSRLLQRGLNKNAQTA